MEQGAHEDLLLNEHGTYTRLVQAQKLREAHEQPQALEVQVGSSATLVEDVIIAEGLNLRPVSLQRADSRSLHPSSSPAVHKRKDYPLLYIFKRLLVIKRGQWMKYAIGSIAAISEWHLSNVIKSLTFFCSERNGVCCHGHCLRFVSSLSIERFADHS